jgi:ABC-type amino acid transport substrate-binding protein
MTASFRKIALSTLAAVTLATTLAATAAEARPRHRGLHWGVGAGIAALAVGGLIAAGSHAYAAPVYGYDEPERRCDLVERVNRFGEVVGYRRVCSLY